jgi:AraC family transcriptional regulator of adaptative response/methylated-DNA-[protein]-cysteine methyltransferase
VGAGYDLQPAVENAARLLFKAAEPLPLPEAARRTGLSPSHLSRLFKEQMGVSLTAFRHRQCCNRFPRLNGQGRWRSMTDSAMDASFGSYAQFYRVCTALMGCTPATYRRQGPHEHEDG